MCTCTAVYICAVQFFFSKTAVSVDSSGRARWGSRSCRSSLVDRRHRHAVAEHAGAAVAAAVPGRLLGIDRALNSGRHRRRLGADVPRVITIILSRRPIVLSTFLSSGFITLFNLSTRASSPPPAAQKLAKGVHVPGLYRRWARGVPAPGYVPAVA